MNAKKEFLNTIKNEKIIGVDIYITDNNNGISALLNPGFSETEYEKFLKLIDVEYDSGYGGQELEGIIICENSVWFDRGEYDGSEWWEKHEYPHLENYFDKAIVLNYRRELKLKRILDDE